MSEESEKDLDALRVVVSALKPLEAQVRRRVLTAALAFLGDQSFEARDANALSVLAEEARTGTPAADQTGGASGDAAGVPVSVINDIRRLKETKDPATGVEMAALVAYYVSEIAPEAERKEAITSDDIKRCFKQANYPLPKKLAMTLVNAKNAGYFDATGRGEYRLNPVGHNLVVHGLPRVKGQAPPKRKTQKKARPNNKKPTRAPKQRR